MSVYSVKPFLGDGGGGSGGDSNVYQVKHTDIEFHRQSGDAVQDYRATISLELRSAIGANKDLLFYTEDIENNLLTSYHFSGNRIYLKCLGTNTYAVYNKLVNLDTNATADLLFTLYYESNDVIFSRKEYPYTKGSVQGDLEYREGYSESFEVFSSDIGVSESVITLSYADTDNVITNLDENKPLAFVIGGLTTVVVDMDSNFHLGIVPLLTKKTIDNFKVGTDPETGVGLYAFRGTLLEYVVGEQPAILFVLFPNKAGGSSGESDYILEVEFDNVDSETTTSRFYIKALVPNEEKIINYMVNFTNEKLSDLGLPVTVSSLEDIINLAKQYKDTLGPVIAGSVLSYGVARVITAKTYIEGVPGNEVIFPVGARFYFEENTDTNTWDLMFSPNPGVPTYIAKLPLAEFEGSVYNITKSNLVSVELSKSTTASGGSSGGSGSTDETLKIILLSWVWTDELYIGIRGKDFEKVLENISQQMGMTITEDMIPTLWANASDYEKLTVVYALTLFKLFASWGDKNVLSFIPTQIEVEGQMVVTSMSLTYLDSSNQIVTANSQNDLSTSGISITTIGGGTSGGSSSTESYYKIELQDSGEVDNEAYITTLKLIVDKQDFNDLVDVLNQQMGSNLSTPQDLIDAYNSMKGDNNYFFILAIVFISLAESSLERNYNALIWRADTFTREKIVRVGDDSGIYCGEIGGRLINATPTLKGQIAFTSSSTLTITEQNNQKL